MNPTEPKPVKRTRGPSANHPSDPLMPPPLVHHCRACREKDEQIARLTEDNRRLNANVDLLRDLIETAAQMAIDEGPMPEVDCA